MRSGGAVVYGDVSGLLSQDEVVVLLTALYEQVAVSDELGRGDEVTPPEAMSLRSSPFEGKTAASSVRRSMTFTPSCSLSFETSNWGTPSKTERSVASSSDWSCSRVPCPKRMPEAATAVS